MGLDKNDTKVYIQSFSIKLKASTQYKNHAKGDGPLSHGVRRSEGTNHIHGINI
jgi:hypothetical protein